MIVIENVTKKYGNKTALNNITISFEKGITGLLGPNGAGKSTLLRILATIDRPSTGKVQFNSKDISEKPKELRGGTWLLATEFWCLS